MAAEEATMPPELDKQIRLAADVLKSFGATEVYVFGSAAEGGTDAESDVDMAVAGLSPDVFFRAWARAVRMLPDREMDLVRLEQDVPFTRYLRETGKLKRVA
jgi:predicted nucleotidyltransferase